MPILASQLLLSMLLSACLGSFTWAMRKFFVQPDHMTTGLRVTLLAGFVFTVMHFVVIFRTSVMVLSSVLVASFLYCLALFIFWSAIRINRSKPLSACFAENEKLHLVQHGPYKFVRHPFYCSYLLTWLAGAVGTLNVWLGLTFITMGVLYLVAAREEEKKFARSPLAEAYMRYCDSTGRFLPKPWKLIASRRSQ